MRKTRDTGDKAARQGARETAAAASRGEVFRFGEAAVRVEEINVNTWQCLLEDSTIGFVTYTPGEGPSGRDYGFRGFHAVSLEEAEHHPATDVNKYSSLRNAARAVVACHYGGRQYTYIHDNVVILDGRVVPESVFRGRKVIKSVLGN